MSRRLESFAIRWPDLPQVGRTRALRLQIHAALLVWATILLVAVSLAT
jgi:hypothetical protein